MPSPVPHLQHRKREQSSGQLRAGKSGEPGPRRGYDQAEARRDGSQSVKTGRGQNSASLLVGQQPVGNFAMSEIGDYRAINFSSGCAFSCLSKQVMLTFELLAFSEQARPSSKEALPAMTHRRVFRRSATETRCLL